MKYRVAGTVMPVLDVQLTKGEAVFTEVGGMAWYKGQLDMKTNMPGGLLGGLGRMVAGESVFLTTYTALSEQVVVTFAPDSMGAIIPIELVPGQAIIAQRDCFMCGQQGIELKIELKRKLGVGLFGGEGFILQRVTGPGVAFFEVDGEAKEVELAAGEVLKVNPGHIAMFESTVQYGIEMIKGVGNVLVGGEGLFMATLTGPGKVWLQTMPLSNLIAKIIPYLPKGD